MALREKWVPIAFAAGLDTETSAKTVVPGTFTEAQNVTFTERITQTKRFGTRLLSRAWAQSSGYSHVSGAVGLASRDDENDLVLLTTTDEVGSYDESLVGGRWVKRGDWAPIRLSLESPSRGPNEAWDATACSSGNIQLWAWEDSRGGVWARLRSLETGVTYGPEFRVGGSSGRSPTAVTVGNMFHVYFVSGSNGTMNVGVVNAANPTASSASLVQLQSAMDPANRTYSVEARSSLGGSRIAISITSGTYVAAIREDGAVGSTGSVPSFPNPFIAPRSVVNPELSISTDLRFMAITVKADVTGSRSIRTTFYDANSFAPVSSATLDSRSAVTANDSTVDRIGTTYWGPSGRFLSAYSSMSSSDPANRSIGFGTLDTLTGATSSGTLVRHTTLTTRPFRLNSRAYLWGTQVSPQQTTDFLVRDDGHVDGVSRYSEAYSIVSGALGHVEVRSDSGRRIARRAVTTRDAFIAVSGGLSAFGDRHVGLQALAYHVSSSWRPLDVAGVLYMNGGYLGKYDGNAVTENNFLLQVEGLSASLGSASLTSPSLGILQSGSVFGSGPLASASFVYEVIPVAFDALGNEEQGGCVSQVQVTLTGTLVSVQNTASLSWRSIAHTRRNGTDAPDIRFKVFRSGFAGGAPLTTRQRVDDPARPIVNSTASDFVTFNDIVPESVRALGEVSYTQLTPVNTPTPAPAFIASQGDRVYLAGCEGQPLDVIPSKLRLGGAVSFTDASSISIDHLGGPVSGLGAVDGNVIVFKPTRLFGFVAEGPDNTLVDQTPFPLASLITSDVGAPEPATIVQVAGTQVQGLIFKSARGLRSISRGVDVVDVGSLVRRYDGLSVVGGLSPSNSEEARFYTSEGTTVVLNTRYDQWSTFTDQPAVAAATWRGTAAYVDSSGYVRVEETGSWLDNQLPYSMRLETGWLPLQGLQGLTRVKRLLILGDFHSHHRMRVEMAVDYRDSYCVIREVDTRSALGVNYYGGPRALNGLTASNGTVATAFLTSSAPGSLFPDPETVIGYAATGTVGNGYPFSIYVDLAITDPSQFRLVQSATGTVFYCGDNTGGAADMEALIMSQSQYLTVVTPSPTPDSGLEGDILATTWRLAGGTLGTNNAFPGATDTYGSGSYGGTDPVYQFEFRLPVERFQTVRFRFTDVDQETSGSMENGRSYSLTEMRLLTAIDTARPSGLPTRKVRG